MFEGGARWNIKGRGCGTGGQDNGKREIPEQLTNLFENSKGELNGQEQTQLSEYYVSLKMCLLRVSSTWGNLIQSSMGLTRTNRPVKQRIRRTPLGFAGEEAQLKKMLGAWGDPAISV